AVASSPPAPSFTLGARAAAVGDPQAPVETFFAILDRHGLLAGDGRLAADVSLVSMGDHFDWGGRGDRGRARASGLEILAWLAARGLATFSAEQRDLVTRLLRAGRFRLAVAIDRDLLLCHAGVTTADLDALALARTAHADARAVADVLNAALAGAVAAWN